MGGIGFRQWTMSANDRQILIVILRRPVAQIVTSRDYDAIGSECIDDDNLVVDYGMSSLIEFFLPLAKRVLYTSCRNHAGILSSRWVAFFPFLGRKTMELCVKVPGSISIR